MNWDTRGTNQTVVGAFNDYKDLLFQVATLYAGTKLIESFDLSTSDRDEQLAISNDFSERMTTIRTVGQLADFIESGVYGQMALNLATLQLCTAFEIFFDRVAEHYSITVTKADAIDIDHYLVGGKTTLGNKALKQIRKIHGVKAIDSVLNENEVLLKIAAIIEVRNCFTHAGGIVTTEMAKRRLWAYRIPCTVGSPLVLEENHLDNFLHYMAMNVLAFVNRAP